MHTAPISFFWDMVTAEVYSSRTMALEHQTLQIMEEVRTANVMAIDEINSIPLIANAMAMTTSMKFNWHPETPKEYLALEEFWTMYKNGVSPEKWYPFLRDKVPTPILVDWGNSVSRKQRIWKPPEERTEDKEAANADPN